MSQKSWTILIITAFIIFAGYTSINFVKSIIEDVNTKGQLQRNISEEILDKDKKSK